MKALTAPARAISAALVLTLAMGGCNKDKTPDHAAAKGEILPRSVTDDMLPYDTVRSQAPLVHPDTVKGSTASPRANATDSADESGTAGPSEAAETPAPTAASATPGAE
ncbi:hypothetical protein [Novosphingobium mangrovi (ex Huang et al. 2023)]|uniref:Argininosuccinate lyase n=1 Tax=Novosphingobium mangrovi (ex Huang et al. 2023) TaxID=2976432 RepID=A0ABT2HZL5_9SPHN|nr:hypothetical protein [Novosphingobium mangrovi (ex Huang et al. 2023)]MCT2397982.1 hypothetical protein [Novosphingobium mangrovi (ex Huang et al. 2023)]